MKRRRVALSLAVIASALAWLSAAARAEPRAVIELFTSQGCSSCPAADKLAGELARDPSLVVMSLPVDYWDYLGWKDTLALPGHTNRQRAYSKARGDREVYTPQVVVNGVAHVLGSDKDAIEQRHRADAQAGQARCRLPVSAVGCRRADFGLGAGRQGRGREGRDLALPDHQERRRSRSARGENSGHTVTYHNVVRRWIKLGDWTGAARTFTVPVRDVTGVGADAVAVVVQAGSKEAPGNMLGATRRVAAVALDNPADRHEKNRAGVSRP